MSTTYPKQIDSGVIPFGTLFFNLDNSIPFVQFGMVVYENVNYDTGTYDSVYTIGTSIPLSEFSFSYIQDANDSNKAIYLKINLGIHTYEFQEGEYQLNGSPLVIMDVVNNINTSLGF